MNKLICLLLILFCAPKPCTSWGFSAHKTINYAAVFTLPKEMFGFYKTHILRLEADAVKPDMRRYINPEEAKRHYLDADYYEDVLPLDTIPHNWNDAVAKYGEEMLNKHGIVPWHIIRLKHQLTKAFELRDFERIIRLSADIGHYVGDLHVPLHSTKNYNGQLTGQHGIHGLWESRLVEIHHQNYDLLTGIAYYSQNIDNLIWKAFEESHSALDTVLNAEIKATEIIGEQAKFTFETRGSTVVKTYSTKFCALYNEYLNGMVERRLKASIQLLGIIWMSAWIDAGQPDLTQGKNIKLSEPEQTDSLVHQHSTNGCEAGH